MEMEIKAKVSDFKDIRKKLKEMGAKYVKEINEKDIYLNHPCRDFSETDEAIRIRISDACYLTYKGPKIDSYTKTREEIEVGIEDPEKMEASLKKLGFTRAGVVEKRREIYSFENIRIFLDDVKSLGLFIEIEILGKELEERKKLMLIGKKLGLRRYIRESYLEMILKNEG